MDGLLVNQELKISDVVAYIISATHAETHAVNKEFWLALRDAAEKMELYEQASRYGRLANN